MCLSKCVCSFVWKFVCLFYITEIVVHQLVHWLSHLCRVCGYFAFDPLIVVLVPVRLFVCLNACLINVS